MTKRLCRHIDLYIGHVAREKIQSSFWPDKLQDWAQRHIYDEMLILSDFWRIFEGTYLRRINCDTGDKQSVETHCVWSVCPPLEKLDAQDLMRLPPGEHTHTSPPTHTHTHMPPPFSHTYTLKHTLEIIQRARDGETVFLVTQYHQFCDLTAQSAHQAFCNFLSLLEVHKARHKWIKKCWRQTDNCYTYECKKVCLALTDTFAITGIVCLGSNNGEPGHGGFLADTSGCIMKCDLWTWTRKWLKPIKQASESYAAAKMMDKPGHVPMLVWHDESESFECTGSIPGISVVNSLSKEYPNKGKFAGGIILRLYVGIGVGIAFTKKQVKKMLGHHTFRGVTRMYESPQSARCGSQLPPKQRRAAKAALLKQTESKKMKRKAEKVRLESHNVSKLARVEGTKKLLNEKKTKAHTKLTFSEAAARVCKHAKSPSTTASCASIDGGRDNVTDVVRIDEGLKEYYTVGDDGIVESWGGPLLPYDMTGWRKVKGGFVRPRPACPCRGMGIREPSTKFEWKDGMKELLTELLAGHTASTAPCEHLANQVMNDGRWSDLDCPDKTHVKNFVQAHFSKHKQAAAHALSRQGKRSYNGLSLAWLKAEVAHRGLTVGRRQMAGCIKLLEKHDDDHEGSLATYHCAPTNSSENASTSFRPVGFTRFRQLIESHRKAKSKGVPLHEWCTKECAYQEIETGRRLREVGMLKLLHKQYNEHSGDIKRHDGDHIIDVDPVYAKGDNVLVLWRGKWYDAIVLKCYPNNTWDVQYPLDSSDQDFSTRLPVGLLKTPPTN